MDFVQQAARLPNNQLQQHHRLPAKPGGFTPLVAFKCSSSRKEAETPCNGSEKWLRATMHAERGSMPNEHLCHVVLPCSWTATILEYAKVKPELTLQLYARMRQEGVQPSQGTFVGLLKACSSLAAREEGTQVDGKCVKWQCLERGRSIHSQLLMAGLESNIYVATTLVDMYAKCGSMLDAHHVFQKMPHRNVVAWNAMILGYAEKQEGEVALQLYAQLLQEGLAPDQRTFVGALKACSSLALVVEAGMGVDCLEKGRGIHSQAVKSGFELDIFVGTTVVDMYAKCGSMLDAHNVFGRLPSRDAVSWTAMILGYADQQQGEMALQLYARMGQEGTKADARTLVAALKACSGLAAVEEAGRNRAKMGCLEKGRAIHSQLVAGGFELDAYVGTGLVDMYAKCGRLEDGRHVFQQLGGCYVAAWNAIILGHAEKQEGEAALRVYARMLAEGVCPDDRTFVATLKACSSLAEVEHGLQVDGRFLKIWSLEKGRSIHREVGKRGFERDVFVGNKLIDMYAKCGSMVDAQLVFDELPHRDVVSWTAIILGYAEWGDSGEALRLYARMKEQGVSPNGLTFVSVLKACGNAAALASGREVHADICRAGLDLESHCSVANSLIDMYGKCGSMVDAQRLFDGLGARSVVAWSALIAGYARQGESGLVFECMERMQEEGTRPHGVTFVSVLTVCSHVGLVHKGEMYFERMRKEHGMSPSMEHYTCMVDLLGRAGQVDEAVVMAKGMPFQPNIVVWRSILGACQKWNNVEMAREAFDCAVGMDEQHAASYVLMSNIYADGQMWEERDEIQSMRKKASARKMPGESLWTDVGGVVHTFRAGDVKHLQRDDIYAKLKDLCGKARG